MKINFKNFIPKTISAIKNSSTKQIRKTLPEISQINTPRQSLERQAEIMSPENYLKARTYLSNLEQFYDSERL